MNSFVKSGSKLFLAVTCFFIFTTFVDQANLLDIIFGNNNSVDIVHPEEVELSGNWSSSILNKTDYCYNKIPLKTQVKFPSKYSSVKKEIITDEDSPFIEKDFTEVTIVNPFFPFEESINYSFFFIKEEIYLQNYSLLI
jgi:hypothetical protein